MCWVPNILCPRESTKSPRFLFLTPLRTSSSYELLLFPLSHSHHAVGALFFASFLLPLAWELASGLCFMVGWLAADSKLEGFAIRNKIYSPHAGARLYRRVPHSFHPHIATTENFSIKSALRNILQTCERQNIDFTFSRLIHILDLRKWQNIIISLVHRNLIARKITTHRTGGRMEATGDDVVVKMKYCESNPTLLPMSF